MAVVGHVRLLNFVEASVPLLLIVMAQRMGASAASPSPLWLGVVYGLIEFLGPVYSVVQFSHRIALIPQGLEGRVNAGYRFIAHALNPVGAALCGVLIERVGAGQTLAFFARVYGLLALARAVVAHHSE
jgi:hypothetical protein